VVIRELSTVFSASVPMILSRLSLMRQKEYARLKKMGRGAGKL
jgi:hypothetical protein